MTKIEYKKCEKLMEEAIQKVKQSDEEFKICGQLINENEVKADIERRKADQHYGEAIGINQVLVTFGFKHDRMKELSKLL